MNFEVMGPSQGIFLLLVSGQPPLGSDGSRSKNFDLGRVNFLWFRSGRVSHLWIWKISPKNVKFSIFFPLVQKKSLRVGFESTRVKGWSASYLLRVKRKLGSGQGPSLPLGLKNVPPKITNFLILLPWDQTNLIGSSKKTNRASFLLRVKSMPGTGQCPSLVPDNFLLHV